MSALLAGWESLQGITPAGKAILISAGLIPHTALCMSNVLGFTDAKDVDVSSGIYALTESCPRPVPV